MKKTILIIAAISAVLICAFGAEMYALAQGQPLNVTVVKLQGEIEARWTDVEEGDIYSVKVNGTAAGETVRGVQRMSLEGLVSEAGRYEVEVTASKSDGEVVANETMVYEHYVRYERPVITGVDNGILRWSDGNEPACYTIVVNGFILARNVAGKEYDVSDTLAGAYDYEICVQAEQNGYRTQSEFSAVYIYSNIVTLAEPDNLSVYKSGQRYILSWSAVPYATGYEISVSETDAAVVSAEVAGYSTTKTFYDISSLITEAADYGIAVSAIADGNFKESEAAAIKYSVFKKLDAPVPTADGKTISWEPIENARSYSVSVNGKSIASELTSAQIDLSSELTLPGYYIIRVQAEGGDNYTASDIGETCITVYEKAQTPSVTVTGSTANWNDVPDALNYTVKVNGAIVSNVYEATSIDLSPYTAGAGKYVISVIANGTGYYLASEEGTAVYEKYVRLQKPNVYIEDGVIRWQSVAGASGYVIEALPFKAETVAAEYDLNSAGLPHGTEVSVYAKGSGYFTDSERTTVIYLQPTSQADRTVITDSGIVEIANVAHDVYEITEGQAVLTGLTVNKNGDISGDYAMNADKLYVIIQRDPADSANAIYAGALEKRAEGWYMYEYVTSNVINLAGQETAGRIYSFQAEGRIYYAAGAQIWLPAGAEGTLTAIAVISN